MTSCAGLWLSGRNSTWPFVDPDEAFQRHLVAEPGDDDLAAVGDWWSDGWPQCPRH